MPGPEADGGELEHAEEVGGALFITRGDTAAMLDPVEEPLDAISFSVERGAARSPIELFLEAGSTL